MKINLVLNNYPSISETFLRSWIVGIQSRGFKIKILVLDNGPIKLEDINNSINNILVLKRSSRILWGTYIINFFKIRKIKSVINYSFINFGNPDLIHFSYSSIAINFLSILHLNSHAKYIVSCRGTSENIKPYLDINRKSDLVQLFKKIDLVHCVSDDMRDKMISDFGLSKSNSFVNRPAIDINNFTNNNLISTAENQSNIIVVTGRLSYVKGLIFAILAFEELKKKNIYEQLELRIIGWGPDEEYLKISIKLLGLENSIKLLGALNSNEIKNELLFAKVFLLPSISEGISNAVLEAMALGIPVVSTSVGGMAEVIKNGENGILIQPFSVESIVQGVSKLLDSKILRDKIRENAIDTIHNNFNLDRLVKVFDEEYHKLINYK